MPKCPPPKGHCFPKQCPYGTIFQKKAEKGTVLEKGHCFRHKKGKKWCRHVKGYYISALGALFLYGKDRQDRYPFAKGHQNSAQKGTVLRTVKWCRAPFQYRLLFSVWPCNMWLNPVSFTAFHKSTTCLTDCSDLIVQAHIHVDQ